MNVRSQLIDGSADSIEYELHHAQRALEAATRRISELGPCDVEELMRLMYSNVRDVIAGFQPAAPRPHSYPDWRALYQEKLAQQLTVTELVQRLTSELVALFKHFAACPDGVAQSREFLQMLRWVVTLWKTEAIETRIRRGLAA